MSEFIATGYADSQSSSHPCDPQVHLYKEIGITALAAAGVTVIVTTHFMAEAEYCDRALILDDGKVLAQGTPAELRALAPVPTGRLATMEDAFLAIVAKARDVAPRKSA